jgi:hypothetical protein
MDLNQTTVSSLAATLRTTPEVLTKFLTEAEASEEVKPFAATLGSLQVISAEDFDVRITRERTEAAQKAKDDAVGNTYDAVDKRIFKATGIAKLPEEAKDSLAYAERAYREKFGSKADESTELKSLRETLEAKDSLLTQATQKLQEMEVAHTTERKQTQINATIDKPIQGLKIRIPADEEKPQEYLANQQAYFKYRFEQAYSADSVDGKVQFTDKATGKIVTDPTRAGNPMDAETLIAQFAPKVVSLKAQSAAQPSGFKPGAPSTDATGAAVIDYTQFNSRDELNTYLKKYGISPTGKEGGVHLNKFKAARPELFK